MSSIYQLRFDNYLRPSGSEPIRIKNQHPHKSHENNLQHQNSSNKSISSKKYTIPFFSKNNLSKSDSKKSNIGSNQTSGNLNNLSKDNQSNNGVHSCNLSMKNIKRKLLASSDSDFLSIIRNNSEKIRKNITNCKSNNNLIYALSDSDFYINVSDNSTCCYKNKNLNLNLLCKNHQAILNKSDILKILMNSKNIDYKNLVDVDNSYQKDSIEPSNSIIDRPDILVDLLDKEIERKFLSEKCEMSEVQKAHSDDNVLANTDNDPQSHSGNEYVDFSAILQLPLVDTTTSLPPCITTDDYDSSNVNHSKSIDTIYSVTSNHNNLEIGWNLNNIEHKSENTLNPIPANNQVLSDASTISLDLVTLPKYKKSSDSSPSNKSPVKKSCEEDDSKKQTPDIIEGNMNNQKGTNGILTTSKNNYRSPMDENGGDFNSGLVHRKRQSSTVTYNVNVINFQNENPSMGGDDDNYGGHHGGGYGGRSNSSTSKNFLYLIFPSNIRIKLD